MGYVTDAAGLLFDGAMTQAVYIIVAVLGLLVCVLGLKLVRVWNVLTGLAVGLGAGMAAGWMLGLETNVILIVSLAAGVILAVLGGVLKKFGAFILCLVGGFSVAVQAINPTNAIMIAVCGAIGLILAILAMLMFEPMVIIVTGLFGGALLVSGVECLLGSGLIWLWYVIALAAALVGMGIQFTLRAREIGKKEVRHAQAVKEEISKEAEVEQMRALLDDDEDEEEE